MDTILKEFLQSGKALVADTKKPRIVMKKDSKKEKVSKAELMGEAEQNPHKIFIRRTIKEKPPKKEVVEQFGRFIEQAESCL